MTPVAIERVWGTLLPAGCRFSAGFEPTDPSTIPARSLPAGEAQAIAGAGQRRRREFATGRFHARSALRQLGIESPELLRCPDGRVAWPAGVCGSVSHTVHHGRIFAVAAVAACAAGDTDWPGIGIDVEAPGRIEPRAWSSLLNEAERARLAAFKPAHRGGVVMALWCGAEALLKAGGGNATGSGHTGHDGRSRFTFEPDPTTGTLHGLRWSDHGLEVRVICEANWTCAAARRPG